jgi:FkbM family methyltransferase
MRLNQLVSVTSLPDLLRFRSGRLKDQEEVTLRLKNGLRCILRANADDNHILAEIFLEGQYTPPEGIALENLQTIVDVGANVGYAILYFAQKYPEATITAFEPHPRHIALIQRHLQLNQLTERVRLVEAGAGVAPDELELTDNGAASTLVRPATDSAETPPAGKTVRVPIVDWLEYLPTTTIDLLKLDAEGAEYDLLNDPRLPDTLQRTRVIALEWHNTASYPQGEAWCSEKLRSLGFTVYTGSVQYGEAGFLWAVNSR